MSITFTKALSAGLAVGNTVTVDFRNQSTGIYLPPTYQQQANNKQATLLIFNETGYGFTFTMGSASAQSKPLPAGGWRSISLPNDVQTLTLTVVYVLPNAPTNTLIMEFCQAGETPDDVGFLGNSPIGLAGTLATVVTQVIQDNQPNGQVIVEATPTGQPQNVLITTDGNATFKGTTTANNVLANNVYAGNTNNDLTYDGGASTLVLISNSGTDQKIGFQIHTGGNPVNVFSLGGQYAGAPTWLSATGAVGEVAGQATAGSFGVPVIVAQGTLNQLISATGLQTLFSFTPPSDGLYELKGAFTFANGSNTNITFWASFTDPNTGGGTHAIMECDSGLLNALAFTSSTGSTNPCKGKAFWAKSGVVINVQFNDAAGTPADRVTAQLWRLA